MYDTIRLIHSNKNVGNSENSTRPPRSPLGHHYAIHIILYGKPRGMNETTASIYFVYSHRSLRLVPSQTVIQYERMAEWIGTNLHISNRGDDIAISVRTELPLRERAADRLPSLCVFHRLVLNGVFYPLPALGNGFSGGPDA